MFFFFFSNTWEKIQKDEQQEQEPLPPKKNKTHAKHKNINYYQKKPFKMNSTSEETFLNTNAAHQPMFSPKTYLAGGRVCGRSLAAEVGRFWSSL